MRRNRLLPLIILLVAGIITIGLMPSILRSLPTRYAMRLPQPLQALALPADTTPLLPTIAAPSAAAGLIAQPIPPPAVVVLTPLATPTLARQDGDTAERAPTPTAPPTQPPTVTPWPVPVAARMNGFTHVYQEWNNRGPATQARACAYFSIF